MTNNTALKVFKIQKTTNLPAQYVPLSLDVNMPAAGAPEVREIARLIGKEVGTGRVVLSLKAFKEYYSHLDGNRPIAKAAFKHLKELLRETFEVTKMTIDPFSLSPLSKEDKMYMIRLRTSSTEPCPSTLHPHQVAAIESFKVVGTQTFRLPKGLGKGSRAETIFEKIARGGYNVLSLVESDSDWDEDEDDEVWEKAYGIFKNDVLEYSGLQEGLYDVVESLVLPEQGRTEEYILGNRDLLRELVNAALGLSKLILTKKIEIEPSRKYWVSVLLPTVDLESDRGLGLVRNIILGLSDPEPAKGQPNG